MVFAQTGKDDGAVAGGKGKSEAVFKIAGVNVQPVGVVVFQNGDFVGADKKEMAVGG